MEKKSVGINLIFAWYIFLVYFLPLVYVHTKKRNGFPLYKFSKIKKERKD